jgi:DNA-binding XRE family transcriptional regulator
MVIKCGEDFGSVDPTRSPTGPLEPSGHRWPRGYPRSLRPEQLRNRHSGFGSAPRQACVYVVVDISDLDGLRHLPDLIMQICMTACICAPDPMICRIGYIHPVNAGQLIRERRLANGLTQAQLALRAGSTQAALSRLERGELSPTVETVERLLAVMGEEADILARRRPPR